MIKQYIKSEKAWNRRGAIHTTITSASYCLEKNNLKVLQTIEPARDNEFYVVVHHNDNDDFHRDMIFKWSLDLTPEQICIQKKFLNPEFLVLFGAVNKSLNIPDSVSCLSR